MLFRFDKTAIARYDARLLLTVNLENNMAWLRLRRLIPFGYRQEKGPPDLEDVFKKMWSGLKKKKNQQQDSGGSQQVPPSGGAKSMSFGFGGMVVAILIIIVLAVIWALSGIFIVQPAEQGAILRFGKYIKTVEPGIHWIPRFIESKYVVNVDQVNAIKLSQVMLTSGENFVKVEFAIQYKIGDLKEFLFNVKNPVSSLQQIVDSAVRQVVGTSQLDNILTVGREKVSRDVLKQINTLVQKYRNGITIVGVQMQPAQPPEQVQGAFDDVIKAREDNQRLQNEAEGYANRVVPVAKGVANAMLQKATAYAQKVVLLAKGNTALFDALLPKYTQAPQVTADRLYFDTMQNVMSHSHLIILDNSNKGGNLTVLPLNQLLKSSETSTKAIKAVDSAVKATSSDSQSTTSTPALQSTSNNMEFPTMTQRQWVRFRGAQANAS